MKQIIMIFTVFTFVAALNIAHTAFAQNSASSAKRQSGDILERHPKSGCYRRDGEHRCKHKSKVGGYSYRYEDSIILDTEPKNQTGPFDSGFFFDTTSAESQYLNN
ncbi:MAG: hypothetical protein AAF228_09890 [Pseudomonadota bacterium]